jgi:hypothetical protein
MIAICLIDIHWIKCATLLLLALLLALLLCYKRLTSYYSPSTLLVALSE